MAAMSASAIAVVLALQVCSSCFIGSGRAEVLSAPCTAPGEQVDVTTFFSPDHSIKPYVDTIGSASTSVDMILQGQVTSYTNQCTHNNHVNGCIDVCIKCLL